MTNEYEQILSAEVLQLLNPSLVIKLTTIIEDNGRLVEELNYLKNQLNVCWTQNEELERKVSSLQGELQVEKGVRIKLEGRLNKIKVEIEKKQKLEEIIQKLVDGDIENDDDELDERIESTSPKIAGRSVKFDVEYDGGEIGDGGGCSGLPSDANMDSDNDDSSSNVLEGYSLNDHQSFSPSSFNCVDDNDGEEMEFGPVTVSKICYDDEINGSGRRGNNNAKIILPRKTGPGRPRTRPDPCSVEHYEIEYSSPPKCSCGKEYQLRGRLLNHIHNVPNRNRKRGPIRS